MRVSAIICTRNRPDLIGGAIGSVLANTYPDFDLLVVDQSDDDTTGQTVRGLMQNHPNLRYMHSALPGLSRAYNTAIRETNGAVLAFTDDDCIAPSDWIASIVQAFEAEPDAEMLYGQVCQPESLRTCKDQIPTLEFTETGRFSRDDGFRVYGMGANFAARRLIFERVGFFDEILGGGGPLKSSQDFDFQYRAYVSGAVVLVRPDVRVDHYGVRNREQWPATVRAYGNGDGAFYFKHVRCGDLFALSLFVRRLVRLSLGFTVHTLRNKPSNRTYLVGCLEGMHMSRRFAVDRERRLYRAA
ncbi:MAG: glycosyltransferase family 2 protein [Chloroflexota bacterium]|nr:glycosyltransferase family 2 protein [Chloroflexota bacterium]